MSVGISPFGPETVERAEWRAYGEDPQPPDRLPDDEGYGHYDDAFGTGQEAGSAFVSESFSACSDVADHDGAYERDERQNDGFSSEGVGCGVVDEESEEKRRF